MKTVGSSKRWCFPVRNLLTAQNHEVSHLAAPSSVDFHRSHLSMFPIFGAHFQWAIGPRKSPTVPPKDLPLELRRSILVTYLDEESSSAARLGGSSHGSFLWVITC